MANTTTADSQSTKKTAYQGNSQKKHPNINEEDINYDQNPGTTTTTINFKNILYNTLPKNTNKKQAKQIEAIIYQVRSKIYSTRNNEYQINYNEARIKQHLMNIIKTVERRKVLCKKTQRPHRNYGKHHKKWDIDFSKLTWVKEVKPTEVTEYAATGRHKN